MIAFLLLFFGNPRLEFHVCSVTLVMLDLHNLGAGDEVEWTGCFHGL